jgi:hypothetical protein
VAGYAWLGARLQMRITTLGRASEKAITGKLSLLGQPGGQPGAAAHGARAGALAPRLAGAGGPRLPMRRALGVRRKIWRAPWRRRWSPSPPSRCWWVGAYLIDAHYLSVGGLIASNLLAARAMALVASLFMVLTKWNDFQRAAPAFRRNAAHRRGGDAAGVVKRDATGQIDVVRLSKRYPERPLALDAVSCAVRPGERIALIGKPASGKSTLLRALAGLTLADEGDVLFDGVALRDISQEMRCELAVLQGTGPGPVRRHPGGQPQAGRQQCAGEGAGARSVALWSG